MPFDFSVACKEARSRIVVPPVPLAAIRAGALQAAPSHSHKRLYAILVTGLSLALLAAVAASWKQTRVWVGDGHVIVTTEHPQRIDHPTQADLANAAKAADFPVVLPTGLPEGTVPASLFKGGRSALMIEYQLPAKKDGTDRAWVVVANPKSFDIKRANSLPQGDLQHAASLQVGEHIVAIFDAHDEIVVVPKGALTTRQLNVMEQAMGEGQGRHVAAHGGFIENPTPADVEAVANAQSVDTPNAEANRELRPLAFKAIVPAGLPPGTKTIFVGRLKGLLLLQYSVPGAWRASNHIVSIVLADPQDTKAEREILDMMPHRTIAARFAVGDEMVLIPSSSLTAGEIAAIRSAMQSSERAQR